MTEGWIAFAQYGVLSILVLYLQDFLLTPEHVARIWGFSAVLKGVQWLYAPVDLKAVAGGLTGLYEALLFATPIFGGILADRVLGKTPTVLMGIILAGIGFGLIGFGPLFVLGIVLSLIGVGCCGSIKVQVSGLYSLDDRRRSDAYLFYTLGIQVAASISPLLCGAAAQKHIWWLGFVVPAAGAVFGFLGYVFWRHTLPKDQLIHKKTDTPKVVLSKKDWKKIILLVGLVLVFAVGSIPNQDISDGYLLWGEQHYDLSFGGFTFPVSDLIALDSFVSAVTAVLVLWFWQWYEKKFQKTVYEVDKIIIGGTLSILGPLFLAAGSWVSPGLHHVSVWWGLAFHTINDIAFAMIFPIGMALFTRVAPASVTTIMLAVYMTQVFFANIMVGKLATLFYQISDIAFWLIHAGCAAVATIIMIFCTLLFRPLLTSTEEKA
nr:MFS transporter [Saccharibacter sp. 17.LH.SD]